MTSTQHRNHYITKQNLKTQRRNRTKWPQKTHLPQHTQKSTNDHTMQKKKKNQSANTTKHNQTKHTNTYQHHHSEKKEKKKKKEPKSIKTKTKILQDNEFHKNNNMKVSPLREKRRMITYLPLWRKAAGHWRDLKNTTCLRNYTKTYRSLKWIFSMLIMGLISV